MEDRRRTYIMFAIVTLACAFGSLAQTATNSMLGGVQASFGTDENTGQWLTTIYMLTIGITVPLVTHLSRRFSVRRLILVSLAFTLVGLLVSAVAPTFLALVCGRVLQAIGTGITLPILQTIAMTRFPPGQNATAMGIAGIAMGFAPNIGPLIGGVLVGTLGWRSFFWMLLAAAAALAVATLLLVSRHEHKPQDAHLDFASFLLSTLGFGGLLLGFSNAANMPLAEAAVWLPALVGVVCLVWFIARQRRIEHPLISMDIFGLRTYVVSFVAQNCLFASFMGITLIVPLFVINVMQLTPVDAGLVFLPVTVLAIVFNPLAGILSDKIGAPRRRGSVRGAFRGRVCHGVHRRGDSALAGDPLAGRAGDWRQLAHRAAELVGHDGPRAEEHDRRQRLLHHHATGVRVAGNGADDAGFGRVRIHCRRRGHGSLRVPPGLRAFRRVFARGAGLRHPLRARQVSTSPDTRWNALNSRSAIIGGPADATKDMA